MPGHDNDRVDLAMVLGDELIQPRRHSTTPDRAGLAIAAGGAMGGALAAVLTAIMATVGPLGLIVAFVAGAAISALIITAAALPVWIVMARFGGRGIGNAALTNAATCCAIGVFAQTYGFGLFDAPPSDMQTLLFRWASAGATSLLLGLIGALIGAVMWRIAYRAV